MCVRCSLVLSRGRSMELIPGMGLDWREGFCSMGLGFGSWLWICFGSGDGVGLVDGRGGDAVELGDWYWFRLWALSAFLAMVI